LEQAIYDVIHEHMRSLNLSYFMFDLKRLNASLGIQFEYWLTKVLWHQRGHAGAKSLRRTHNGPTRNESLFARRFGKSPEH
jgi:hypothetical protein